MFSFHNDIELLLADTLDVIDDAGVVKTGIAVILVVVVIEVGAV